MHKRNQSSVLSNVYRVHSESSHGLRVLYGLGSTKFGRPYEHRLDILNICFGPGGLTVDVIGNYC